MADPYVGEIRMVGFNFAPAGWALCNGQLLSVSQYQALFALLGITYGGNGQTTFGLPNLQSRVPVGVGQGPGLSTYSWGDFGGQESITLTQGEMPVHTHGFTPVGASVTIQAGDGSGSVSTPDGNYLVNSGSPDGVTGQVGLNFAPASAAGTLGTIAGTALTFGSGAISSAGGSQPFPTVPPYLAFYFIIALNGIYPVRQ